MVQSIDPDFEGMGFFTAMGFCSGHVPRCHHHGVQATLTESIVHYVLVNSYQEVYPLGFVTPMAIRKHFTLAVPVIAFVVPAFKGFSSEPVMVSLHSPHLVQ